MFCGFVIDHDCFQKIFFHPEIKKYGIINNIYFRPGPTYGPAPFSYAQKKYEKEHINYPLYGKIYIDFHTPTHGLSVAYIL